MSSTVKIVLNGGGQDQRSRILFLLKYNISLKFVKADMQTGVYQVNAL